MIDTYGIGEAAQRLGLSIDTLRYYEQLGVTPSPARNSRGQRRYTEHNLHLLEVIVHLRRTAMPLQEIKRFTAWVQQDPSGVEQRLEILLHHRQSVIEQIHELNESLTVVDQKIADYRGRL